MGREQSGRQSPQLGDNLWCPIDTLRKTEGGGYVNRGKKQLVQREKCPTKSLNNVKVNLQKEARKRRT